MGNVTDKVTDFDFIENPVRSIITGGIIALVCLVPVGVFWKYLYGEFLLIIGGLGLLGLLVAGIGVWYLPEKRRQRYRENVKKSREDTEEYQEALTKYAGDEEKLAEARLIYEKKQEVYYGKPVLYVLTGIGVTAAGPLLALIGKGKFGPYPLIVSIVGLIVLGITISSWLEKRRQKIKKNIADIPVQSREALYAQLGAMLEKAKLNSRLAIVSLVLMLVLPFVFVRINKSLVSISFFGFLAAAVCFWIASRGARKKLAIFIGMRFVTCVLGEVFELELHSPNGCVAGSQINETGLIGGWKKCAGSDLVKGKYKGVPIEFSDITLKDGEKTAFKGQWIEIGLKKPLESVVYLAERTGVAGGSGGTMQEIQTNNSTFNKKYQIFTDNPQAVPGILTQRFMENIIAADKAADSDTLFCFKGDRVRIAMKNKRDLFFIGKLKKVKNANWLKSRIMTDIRCITAVLDELLQNEYLFGTR